MPRALPGSRPPSRREALVARGLPRAAGRGRGRRARGPPRCSDASSRPASPCSRPSISSTGAGPPRSTAPRSRTSSAWPSSSGHANRDLSRRRRPGQEPPDDRPGPRRVPARLLRAVHHRHRHHQHAGRRAGRRLAQARNGSATSSRTSLLSTSSATCPSTSSAPTAVPDHQPRATSAAPPSSRPTASTKHWPEIFNNDSTLTSALLDRLLHHAETVIIEGRSYRARDNQAAA